MNDIMVPRRQKRPTPAQPTRVQDSKPLPPVELTPPPPRPEPAPEVKPAEPSPAQPKKRRLKWLWISLLVLLLLTLAAAGGAYWWYNDNLQARSSSSERIQVRVEDGDTVEIIANQLEQKSVVRNALVMTLYMKLNNQTNIKSGNYLFAPNQTPQEIASWLNEGRVDTFKVTILPGQTLTKLKKSLTNAGYSAKAVDQAFAKTYKHPLLAKKPANASLEGYIYPETYFVTSDTSVEQLFTVAFDEFEKQLKKNDTRKALAARKFSLHQGIILASIIEREVADKDQRQVAQVFYKRLQDGMPLGADATYHYAAERLKLTPSADIDSPYNTRKYKGLPPGPIANFPISALESVAHPADGSYLYFVSGDDGNTYFAHTFAEHEANVSKYCQKLCSRF
jgi:UPF0755 protein